MNTEPIIQNLKRDLPYKRLITKVKRKWRSTYVLLECGHAKAMPHNQYTLVVGKQMVCRECQEKDNEEI